MDKEIIKYTHGQSFEEFKMNFMDDKIETIIQEYKQFGLRLYKHILSRIDLTGIIDFINKENDQFELEYFKERVARGIFEILQGYHELKTKYEKLEDKLLQDEIPILLYHYDRKVINEVNSEKIYYFRNVVCNGFVNSKLNIEEKILFLNLLSEITYDQINILAILYEFQTTPNNILTQLEKTEEINNITIEMVSKLLDKDIDNIRILTNNLIGKGLVIKITRYVDFDRLKNDSKIGIEEFVKVFIKQIKEIN
ncbi:MAG: hypothetical protein ACFFG0_42945 [Candidatus Thorarchaeota archaeon]